MTNESTDPHANEEDLQTATDRETARHGEKRYEFPEALDETELGGGEPPAPKGRAWNQESIRLSIEEAKAKSQIRANKARTDAGLPPIDIK